MHIVDWVSAFDATMVGVKALYRAVGGLFAVAGICVPLIALAQTTPQQTGPTAPTCTISATPTSVTTGGSITLKWSSTDADGGSISRVGTVGPSGQLNILLSAAGEVTFAGTFTGPGGTATCKTSVLVNAKTTGTSSTGSSYTSGSYSTGSYTTGSYTVDPNNFKTTATGITSSNTGGTSAISGNSTGVSSFLVPCGLTSADSPLGATSCTICSFGQLIQNLINFLIILAIPLSAGLFAWAGILRFTSYGNTSRLAKSKSIFKSVAIGLAIALSGYLIVQTLLNSLMNQNFFSNGWSWKTLNCSGDRPRQSKVSDIFKNLYVSPNATITTGGTGTGTSGGTGGAVVAGASETDQAARNALANACQAGVNCFTYTSHGNCSDPTVSTCTSLDGIKEGTVNQLIALQKDCGCVINISGATETGHGGTADNVHTQGLAVDLSKNASLNGIIQSYTQTTATVSGSQAAAYRAPNGVLYIDEGNHWHMQVSTK